MRRLHAARRTGRRRRTLRTGVLGLFAASTLLGPAPMIAPGLACEPDAARVQVATLAGDGEVERVEHQGLLEDGTPCEPGDGSLDELGVAVSVMHRDEDGRTIEASQLERVDGPVRTTLEVRDRTAAPQDLEVTGPQGSTATTRTIGRPQLVHLSVSYPDTWEVTAPAGDGITTRTSDGRLVLTRTGVLFPPLLPSELPLQVTAVPGAGTPSVEVEATPLSGQEPFVLPEDLLDRETTAVLGGLLTVALDGVEEVADGTQELANGTGELADGAGELAGGARELADGTGGLADGAGELAGGADGLAAGTGELVAGTDQLAGGLQGLSGGAGELAEGTGSLAGAIDEAAAQAAPLAGGARELAEGANELAASLEAADPSQGAAPDLDALVAEVGQLSAGVREVRDSLAAVVPALPDGGAERQAVTAALATLDGLATGLDELAGGLQDAAAAPSDVGAGLQQAAALAGSLATGLNGLADGAGDLVGGLGELADGAGELAGGARGLAEGTGELAGGAGELADGVHELADGADGLATGAGELASGAGELAGGARGVADGAGELADGAGELADGTGELADGAGELPEALAELLGITDRRGQDAATISAVLDRGSRLADEHRGEAVLVTQRLRHQGSEPLPWAAIGMVAGALAVLVLLLLLARTLTRAWQRRQQRTGDLDGPEAAHTTLASTGTSAAEPASSGGTS